MINQLTEDTLFFYAAQNYYKPQFSDVEEFFEDLKRFKYIKRLVNRYIETENFPHRLLLNHIIIIFNVFGIEAANNILNLRLDDRHWPVIKPILLYLNYITEKDKEHIESDPYVVKFLGTI